VIAALHVGDALRILARRDLFDFGNEDGVIARGMCVSDVGMQHRSVALQNGNLVGIGRVGDRLKLLLG